MFKNLKSLCLYGEPPYHDHDRDLSTGLRPFYDRQLAGKSYSGLLQSLDHVAPTLRTLELPRGFWCLPNIRKRHEYRYPYSYNPEHVVTGELVDFRAFPSLEHLIVPKTAITAKRHDGMTLAKPVHTLPSSLRRITVYGADEELIPWLEDILHDRHSHFSLFRHIRFIRKEPLYSEPKMKKLLELDHDLCAASDRLAKSGINFSYWQ